MLGILHNRRKGDCFNGGIDTFCKKRQRCDATKQQHIKKKTKKTLRHILASKPLEVVVIDFTLLESNSKGYEYVVVIIDVFY